MSGTMCGCSIWATRSGCSDQVRLGLEPPDELRLRGQLAPDLFDRHLSIDRRLDALPHHGKCPCSDLLDESIPPQWPALILDVERRVTSEEGVFEVEDRLRWFEAADVGNHPPVILDHAQRLGGPPAAVQS